MADTISSPAANALIYCTLVVMLGIGIYGGRLVKGNVEQFLTARGTQSVLSLGINFVAMSIGTGMLYSMPEVATIGGLVGLIAYSFACVVPILILAPISAVMQKRYHADVFSLSSFCKARYGRPLHILVALCTTFLMALYLSSEFSGIGSVVFTLTGLNRVPPMIVVAVVTTAYTMLGGLRASLFTDAIQGYMILGLVIISAIGIGINIRIPAGKIDEVGLIKPTRLSWELFYIMTAALVFSNMFHQGFWQRAFSAKNNRTLFISTIVGSSIIFPLLFAVGVTGLIAAWSGVWTYSDDTPGSMAFFSLIAVLPLWMVGITIVLAVCLACCAADTLQTAMVGSISDLFDNRFPLWACRALVLVVNAPALVLAFKETDTLRLYMIADLVASAMVVPLLCGLSTKFDYVNGFDAIVGAFGGIVGVGVFGTVYFGNATDGWQLLGLMQGLYAPDQSVLGAFLVAPIASFVVMILCTLIRIAVMKAFGFRVEKHSDTVYRRQIVSTVDESNADPIKTPYNDNDD